MGCKVIKREDSPSLIDRYLADINARQTRALAEIKLAELEGKKAPEAAKEALARLGAEAVTLRARRKELTGA